MLVRPRCIEVAAMGAKCSNVEKGDADTAAPSGGPCCEVNACSVGTPSPSAKTIVSALQRRSTRAPSWQGSFRPMRIDHERVSRRFKVLQRLALEVVGQLNHFHVFVNTSCAKPGTSDAYRIGEAFEWLTGCSDVREISFDEFTRSLEKHRFTGQSDKVFFALCEDPKRLQNGTEGLIIARSSFIKRLMFMGNPFRLVVRQAIANRKFGIEFRDITATSVESKQARPNEATGCHRVNAKSDPIMNCTAKGSMPHVKRGSSLDCIADNPQDGNSQHGFQAP